MKVNKTIKKEELKNYIADLQLNNWKIINQNDNCVKLIRYKKQPFIIHILSMFIMFFIAGFIYFLLSILGVELIIRLIMYFMIWFAPNMLIFGFYYLFMIDTQIIEIE